MNLDKTYDPKEFESHWYNFWESQGYFAPSGKGKPFCIMLPPPNVTGSLHMGHGFGFTLVDILIRYHRMMGSNVLWQGGCDHAGIATQMVVERQLSAQGIHRTQLGREAFIEKIWEWRSQSGGQISQQLRRLGASIDWEREKFTLDESMSYAVREVFIRLYDEGLIYRGKRLVNWDPVLLTAISDLEVSNEEEKGHLWYIRYPLTHRQETIVVATTRPETLLGDVAVAVHPNDERYQHLIGEQISLPLTNRLIPIIADEMVDPLFGTGCVKITPAHDFNDYIIGKKHGFEPINIFAPNASLNQNAPAKYEGLDRFIARERVLEDLTALNLVEKIAEHRLKVPRGDRSQAIIEPYLTYQWYVNTKFLAKPAIHAVEQGAIQFIPENWQKTYFQWMENIEDWCISRQLWWGHRIPVWYDENDNTYVGHDETDVRKRYQLSDQINLKQDEDVLDTWFSSALWPFATLGWPQQTEDFDTFFPTSILITGFDIIFFWVARMIMMSLKFTQQIPFREVYITGLIRDAEGQKMSKSKGNVLDPIDLIDGITLDALLKKRLSGLMQPAMAEKIAQTTCQEFPEGIPNYGTDALRMTFCGMASYTREIRFDMSRLQSYRNFCNKLWNASRYVLMNTANSEKDVKTNLSLIDRYILSQLQKTIITTHDTLSNYRFDLLAQALYEFTWNEFCDWYLELSKPVLTTDSNVDDRAGTKKTLLTVLETLLRLLHPVMPFITEAIWQHIKPLVDSTQNSIMIAPFPTVQIELIDDRAEKIIAWLKQVIIAIRNIRSETNIAPNKILPILFRRGNDDDRVFYQETKHLLISLGKLKSVTWLEVDDLIPTSASAFVGDLEIYTPLADLINKEEEIKRLRKELAKLQKDLVLTTQKLANPNFLERAPDVVIQKERDRLATFETTITKLQKQIVELQQLD